MTKREIDKTIREMMRAEKQFQQLADTMENRLLNAFHRAQQKVLTRVSDIMATMPSAAAAQRNEVLAWYLSKHDHLQTAFIESGYLDAIEKYIDAYPDLARLASKMIVAGGIDPALASFPHEIIDQLQKRDALFFRELNTSAMQYLDRTFLNTVIAADSKYGLLPKLRGEITGDYKWGSRRGLYEWHAGTYARTMHRRFARSILASKAAETGLENFMYVGPNDGAIRPFCSNTVFRVFTRTEIEQMDNGQTGDVMIDGGGYNCRHNWMLISDELAKSVREQYDGDASQSPAVPELTPPPGSAVPRFQSKTEAEQWMADNLVCGGKNTGTLRPVDELVRKGFAGGNPIKLRDVTLDSIQAMVDQLYAMKLRGNLPPLSCITNQGEKTCWAFVGNGKQISTGEKFTYASISRENKLWAKQLGLSSDEYAIKHYLDNMFWTSKTADDLGFHEAVHYWQSWQSDAMQKRIVDIYTKALNYSQSVSPASNPSQWIHKTISQYANYAGTEAKHRPWEFLSESMVKIRREGTAWIPDELRDPLIEIAGKVGAL